MGANLKESATTRAAQSVTALGSIRDSFDRETGVPTATRKHSMRSEDDDINRVVSVLQTKQVLAVKHGRKHSRFPSIPANPLYNLDQDKLITWMQKKQEQWTKFRVTIPDTNDIVTDDEC